MPGGGLLTFVAAGALGAAAWIAFRSVGASREAAAAEEWACRLDYDEARAAFEKGRDMMADHLVDPCQSLIRSNRDGRKVAERAVAARSRMNEIAGQPHGPGFRLGYRTELVQECKRIADAVPAALDEQLARFGPLVPPGAEPRLEPHAARKPARARLQ